MRVAAALVVGLGGVAFAGIGGALVTLAIVVAGTGPQAGTFLLASLPFVAGFTATAIGAACILEAGVTIRAAHRPRRVIGSVILRGQRPKR